ncbi:reverse transcriptase domain-containing protein [Clostridiisalibacter paucivorans]|uniref:reverse transcriptase domain-containing protein n=1 Tax=Clostridiisalibacter paucivorans TaxID=408753 RepID=UPI0006862744|nr:reverse transcriptase domain-containing protein [Clostridiisalibacter paucivorans]
MKPTADILERIYKNSNEHKNGVYTRLYRYLLREDIYYSAYQKLYSNKGASTKGIDNDTADGFGEKYVESLIEELRNNTYRPKPVRREYIKKPNGNMRPLGIPSFRDKLLQEVIRRFLEAIYEPVFSDFSHGFRPNRSCHTALKQTLPYFKGTRWFVEGDIKGCFDNIDHEKLIEILQRKIKDSKFINIIRSFLKTGYIEDFRYNQTYSGTPQGGILSPILANIYLNELDNKIMEIKQTFDKPAIRSINPEYDKIRGKRYWLQVKLKKATEKEKPVLISKINEYSKELLKIPYKSQTDKNIAFVRYADDCAPRRRVQVA